MDHVQDQNHVKLFRIYSSGQMPDFVLREPLLTQKEASRLPTSSFADIAGRTFPTNTKGNTWMSIAFFNRSPKEVRKKKPVKKLLDKAAEFWQLADEDLKAAEPMEQKTAGDDGVKIVYDVEGVQQHVTYVHDADELQKSAEHLMANRGLFPYYTRRNVAETILDTRKTFNHTFPRDLTTGLQKIAGRGVGMEADVHELLTVRTSVLRQRSPETVNTFETIIEQLPDHSSNGIVHPGFLRKIAALTDAGDRISNLHRRYSGSFTFPEDTLFSVTRGDVKFVQKHACVLPGGLLASRHQIRKNASELVEDLRDRYGLLKKASEKTLSTEAVIEALQKLAPHQCRRLSTVHGLTA